nr:glycosyltransferase [uncultured Dyadobacter sp.]
MFSVIIPLYNKVDYIRKTVDSVLGQTFQNFELLVVDDGSTDGSARQLVGYQDDRLRIISQANAGVSTARNNGARHARFDYILFLDADDWWHDSLLQEMNALIGRFPGAGMYGCKYYLVKNGKTVPADVGLDAGFEAGYIDYFQVYARTFWVPINCSFVVVDKSVFEEEGGFKPFLKFGEDFDLWVRIALKHKVGYANKFLAYSNQDVKVAGRALGISKPWSKSEHVIFNLGYLHREESLNPSLKLLLDGLRVRALLDFYINSRFSEETRAILKCVDFLKQPAFYRFVYHSPRGIVVAYFRTKYMLSRIKQSLIKTRLRLQTYRLTD